METILSSGIWNDIKRIDSTDTNVAKFVFTTETAVAEAVLYKYPTYQERTVICCSTMSGCPVGCRFCGAGDAFVRSLTVDEIVAQPIHLLNEADVDPASMGRLQIMFMSMGEPLLNMKALGPAMDQLYELFPNAALLISTSGPRATPEVWQDLCEQSARIPTIGLQFSVHESTDTARNELIPFQAKLSLIEIASHGEVWYEYTGRQPFFNYCVHPGNNSSQDANNLYDLFDPETWQATISVICERDENVAAANERQRALAEDFQTLLRFRGYSTRMFDPAGQDDTGSGCGQFWYVQKWMREHPKYANRSVGAGLPVLHTPRPETELVAA